MKPGLLSTEKCLWREGGPANELCPFPPVITLYLEKYSATLCRRHEPAARKQGWTETNEDLFE